MSDFVWVTILRILTALAALAVPLPAMWLSGHIDRWDWSLLGMPTGEHQQLAYQYWDKSLDTLTLTVVLIIALQWKDPIARRIAIVAFAWRVAGVIAFMVTEERAVFVVFPSVLEKVFFFYLLFRVVSRHDIMFRTRADIWITMLALTLPKVVDEYFMHVGARPWQTMQLLPATVSTPGSEYWAWMSIMLMLPVLAMVRLLLQRREPDEARIPLVTALLGRQVSAPAAPANPNFSGTRPFQSMAEAFTGLRHRTNLPILMGKGRAPAILEQPRPTTSELPIETRRPIIPHSR